ncbi:MAG: outer membrane protein assembly factor BamE [Pontiella sp.]|nr:outer membrane protein assembly factor BamE [Pontiella sp.]MBT8045598.1 outer membrane protein assembly factor BamE [Pontiella sp.]NNJ71376.1 outer membrane protein assembly factor BamE [Kiritimatiellales bacterium]
MKTMSLLLIVLTLFVAGCATTFKPWLLSEIHEGMDRQQVIKILGEPDYAASEDETEYLYYTYAELPPPAIDFSMESESTMERQIQNIKRSLTEYKYEVMIADGKVVNYKELTD